MKYCEAQELMKQGIKIKMPNWIGYWAIENGCIMMHTKDGRVLDIRETEDVFYTLGFIMSDEWIIANKTNCRLLQDEVV